MSGNNIYKFNPFTENLDNIGEDVNKQSAWLDPALEAITTPPVNPVVNGRYLILGTGTGAWTGQNNKIAVWNGSNYVFETPSSGNVIQIISPPSQYTYSGTTWVASNVANSLLQNGNSFTSSVRMGSANNQNVEVITNNLWGIRVLTNRNVIMSNTINDAAFEWNRTNSRLTVRGNSDAIGTSFSAGGLSSNALTVFNNGRTSMRSLLLTTNVISGANATTGSVITIKPTFDFHIALGVLNQLDVGVFSINGLGNFTSTKGIITANGALFEAALTIKQETGASPIWRGLNLINSASVTTVGIRYDGTSFLFGHSHQFGNPTTPINGFHYRGGANVATTSIARFTNLAETIVLEMFGAGRVDLPNLPLNTGNTRAIVSNNTGSLSYVTFNTNTALGRLGGDVQGIDLLQEWTAVPLTETSPGEVGQKAADSAYIYFCISPSLWAKVTRLPF
jgi:hypothetical protein